MLVRIYYRVFRKESEILLYIKGDDLYQATFSNGDSVVAFLDNLTNHLSEGFEIDYYCGLNFDEIEFRIFNAGIIAIEDRLHEINNPIEIEDYIIMVDMLELPSSNDEELGIVDYFDNIDITSDPEQFETEIGSETEIDEMSEHDEISFKINDKKRKRDEDYCCPPKKETKLC